MFTITVKIKTSKKEDADGAICFVLNEGHASRLFKSEVLSAKDALMADNLDYVLSGIKLLCDIIEDCDSGLIEDVADRFQSELPNLKIRKDLCNGFSASRRLVCIGKPFDKYVSASETKPKDRLTVGNIVDYICCLLDEMKDTARPGTYTNYNSTLCAVTEYVAGLENPNKEIEGDFVTGFAEWNRDRGLIESTISFYLRTLRTILGKAQDDGLIVIDKQWYNGYTTGYKPNVAKLEEQTLTKEELRLIAGADLKVAPRVDVSRDAFMFSFYCHGMELIDILNLKRSNVTGDYLIYNKRLAGQQELVVVDAPIRKIIRKYSDKETGVLMSISKFYNNAGDYKAISKAISNDMAALFKLLGIIKKFQFSMARNSWDELVKRISLSELLLS
ncbi:MAG: site-specific integrase [Muribaculum sp.]|nr:site-specific integrase [Muribaculum sp.]